MRDRFRGALPARGRRRRAGALALLMAGVLALAGCSGVPSDGLPHSVRKVPANGLSGQANVRSQPNPPGQNDKPDRIVRGFLLAAKSAAGDYDIARQFLTAAGSRAWSTRGDVGVVSVTAVTVSGKGADVTVTGERAGSVSRRSGTYHVDGSKLSLHYGLRRVDGQWRIDKAPPGILLLQSDFGQVFQSVDLYYLNTRGDRVIGDRRYLADERPALATTMVRQLLAAPADWLAPGAHSAFPQGTSLRTNVVADGDVLVVDLTEQATSATPDTRRSMAAQLAWTLQNFGVRGIRITVEGRPFAVPGQGDLAMVSHYSSFNPDSVRGNAYFLVDGVLTSFGGLPVAGRSGRTIGGLTSAAVSGNLAEFAGTRPRKGGGSTLVVGAVRGAKSVRVTGRTLSAPSWGQGSKAVYVVVDSDHLERVRARGGIDHVALPAGAVTGPISAVRVSRGGVRIALIAGSGDAARLLVGVLSDRGGSWRVTGLRSITPDLHDVRAVSWSDSETLAVLASGRGSVTPWTVGYDGAGLVQGPTSGLPGVPVAIATTNQSARYPDLVQVGGQVLRRAATTWVSPVPGGIAAGTDPFYPGG